MEDQLISFETAILAKEKGFDELCIHSFDKEGNEINESFTAGSKNSEWGNKTCTRSTQSLLKRWLRKKGFNIHIIPTFDCFNIISIFSYDKETQSNEELDLGGLDFNDFSTYEEALEEGLKHALRIIK